MPQEVLGRDKQRSSSLRPEARGRSATDPACCVSSRQSHRPIKTVILNVDDKKRFKFESIG